MILYEINGFDNAMEFVEFVKGLAKQDQGQKLQAQSCPDNQSG